MSDLDDNKPPRFVKRRSGWILAGAWCGLGALSLLSFLVTTREHTYLGSPTSQVPSTQYASTLPESTAPAMPHSTAPRPAPGTSSAPVSRSLADFIDECELGAAHWRAAQVAYPRKLALEKGVPQVYLAAVDVRDFPVPVAQVVPGPDPAGAAIEVKCALSARLVADGSMTVDPPTWTFREFNPAGFLNWTWSVNASTAGARQLRLELQPAVVRTAGRSVDDYPTEQVLTYLTDVGITDPSSPSPSAPPSVSAAAVSTPPPTVPPGGQGTGSGFWQAAADNWKIITGVASSIGAAVLGLLAWLRKVDKEVRSLWKPGKKAAAKPKAQKTAKRKSGKT
ncbi:hypothetical protein ACWED2_31810 [Amycolatopsis sp. NPDC005003]